MKIRSEIEIEAAQLEQRGQQIWIERRGVAPVPATSPDLAPVVLLELPESTFTLNASRGGDELESHRMLRRLDVDVASARPEFRLMEEEFVTNVAGQLSRHYEAIALLTSVAAVDVLQAGYRRLDEDRLTERLDPIAERMRFRDIRDPATREEIAEIEKLTEDLALSPAARLRMRADVIALLKGQLEPGDFVARTVERQECYREKLAETMVEQIHERIEVA